MKVLLAACDTFRPAAIDQLKTQMIEAAKRMDFLEAAQYRDEILKLEALIEERE